MNFCFLDSWIWYWVLLVNRKVKCFGQTVNSQLLEISKSSSARSNNFHCRVLHSSNKNKWDFVIGNMKEKLKQQSSNKIWQKEQDCRKLYEQTRPLMEHSMYPRACSFLSFLPVTKIKTYVWCKHALIHSFCRAHYSPLTMKTIGKNALWPNMWESTCINLNIQSICQCNCNKMKITLNGLPEEYNMIATKFIYFFLTTIFSQCSASSNVIL